MTEAYIWSYHTFPRSLSTESNPMAQTQQLTAAPPSLFSNSTPVQTPTPAAPATTPSTVSSGNHTFLMTASPVRNRRSAAEGYKPKLISTIGAKPACLVNASVTYVGNDQIYAFGGFDQFTDEGRSLFLHLPHLVSLINRSLQSCPASKPGHSSMEFGRQLRRHTRRSHGPHRLFVGFR